MLRYINPDGTEIAVRATLTEMEEATGIPAGKIYLNIIRTRHKIKAGQNIIKPYFVDDEPYRRKSNKDIAWDMFDGGATELEVIQYTQLKPSTIHEYYLTWQSNTGKGTPAVRSTDIPAQMWIEWEKVRKALLCSKYDLSKIKLERAI